jgi:glucose/arabinose dehydrogenase
MRRTRLVSLVLALALVGACRWILPERYAVNAPLGHLLLGRGVETPAEATIENRLRAPDGLSVGLFAGNLENARMLRVTAAGDLLVSTPRSGRVVLLERDGDGDGRSDAVRTLLQGLDRPHGIDVHDGWLYVAEADGIGRIEFDAAAGATRGTYARVVDGLPAGGNHWTRSLRFGPDGWMYVTVGSSCNVCEEQDPRRAVMLRYRPDGSGEEIVARGLRNAVGFDWQPGTNRLYATDNGRDLLGDDFPPCELNLIVPGGFYGWPYVNGYGVPDPDFGPGNEARAREARPPVHGFRAHNAPLGITFLRSQALAPELRGVALVALHGSWNRTHKDGYKVVSLRWGPDGDITEKDFLTGFERDEDVIGRPVDVAEGPDGAIYVSDDYAGAVYRVSRGGASAVRPGAAAAAPAADPLAALPSDERATRGERGRALYASLSCAVCHDPEHAAPGVTPIALRGLASRYSVESLAQFLAAPTPPMPAIELGSDSRRDLAIHLLGAHP